MRNTLAALAIAVLFTAVGSGQTDKTFYFTQPASAADITAMTTMIRTVVDLQDIMPDAEHQAVKARGPVDKLVAAGWLFDQLDRAGAGSTAQYKMSGGGDDTVSVFRVSPAASNADLTALTTAIRTVTDIQRLFPLEAHRAIVARSTPEKIAAADWMVHQLLPPEGEAPTTDSPAYPMEAVGPGGSNEVIQVFRMDPKTTNSDLTAMVTAIRTIADLQRLFPFWLGKAVIARGAAERVAVGAWLIHETAKPSDRQATHETSLPGLADGVVRLFFLPQESSPADLTALATEIRSTAAVMRILPLVQPAAVVLRGRPDQIATAELLADKFAGHAQ